MQPDAAAADQHHAGDGGDEGLRQVVDHDGGDPVQRRVDAPQRAAQQPLGLLHDRMTEVDVHQVVAALGGVGVERDRARHIRLQPGVEALAAWPARRRVNGRHARTPRRRVLRSSLVRDRHERELVVDPQRGVDHSAQVRRLEVHLGARRVEALLQLGQPGVELHAAGERRVDHLVGVDALRLAPAPACAPAKCSWISSPMTWLTEPRSCSTLATFLAMRRHELGVGGVGRRASVRDEVEHLRFVGSARSGRSGRCAAPAGTG